LGADEVIDYTTQRFEAVLQERPVDAVIDGVVHGERLSDYQNRRQGHVLPPVWCLRCSDHCRSGCDRRTWVTSGDHVLMPAAARSMSVLKRSGTYVSLFPMFEVLPILKG
jgi:hypothetical protein